MFLALSSLVVGCITLITTWRMFGQLNQHKESLLSTHPQTGLEKPPPSQPQFDREFYEAVLQIIPMHIYVFDVSAGKNVYINQRFTAFTGYTLDDLRSLDNRLVKQLIHPEDYPHVVSVIEQMLNDPENNVYEVEYRIKCKDGEWRWVRDSACVFKRTLDGASWQTMGVLVDITDQKAEQQARQKAEQQLVRSESALRAQYNGIPTPTYTWQRSGDSFVLSQYNRAADFITEGKLDKYIGSRHTELFNDAPDIIRDIDHCYKTRQPSHREMHYRFKSTREMLYLNVHYTYIPPDMVMVTTEDITERKIAEEVLQAYQEELERQIKQRTIQLRESQEKLRQSEERFQLAVKGSRDGIWDWDVIADDIYASPRVFAMLGLSDQQVDDPVYAMLLRTHHSDKPRVVGELESFFRGKSNIFQLEFRLRHASGQYLNMLARGVIVRDENGHVLRVAGTLTDITELRRTETAERQNRILAESLFTATEAINRSLHLDEVLNLIVTVIKNVVAHDMAMVMLFEDGYAYPGAYTNTIAQKMQTNLNTLQFEIAHTPIYRDCTLHRRSVIIEDTTTDDRWVKFQPTVVVRSYIGTPILHENQVLGSIDLFSVKTGYFTQSHIKPLQAFATQAAIAINNARLYEQAQQLGVLEERQRLARDLHDAVSQVLFSASIIAESIPQIYRQSPGEVETLSREVALLTRGALAEMRSLLVELRPESMVNAELDLLIRHLVDAFSGRTRVPVEDDIQHVGTLPEDAQMVFYRVAQEALNNIAKHAKAKKVRVKLTKGINSVTLLIADDGIGFDTALDHSDRFGMSIMQERAKLIGSEYHIASEVGVGTTVRLTWGGEKTS